MGKRLFDIVVSGLLLIIFSIPLLVLALLVRIKLGSPIFFRQGRAGFHGREFRMIKFRSMTDARDDAGHLLPDDERLPRFGKLLRATSLDELPELINVLTGDMSLVGPRPLLTRYLERYTAEQSRRHEVRPGITGWAQVNGRNNLPWEERFKLDVWYVDHRSLGLDLKILWMTFLKVIKRSDVSQEGHATMSEFMGSSN
jgi:sugar transferase EpsL